MRSRYTLMKESTIKDLDDVRFPDPLSLSYKELVEDNSFVVPALQVEVDETFIRKPYLRVSQYYNKTDNRGYAELDDIVLDLNNVLHVNLLKEGDIILFPDPTELETFISENTTGE